MNMTVIAKIAQWLIILGLPGITKRDRSPLGDRYETLDCSKADYDSGGFALSIGEQFGSSSTG